ncbi:MAG: alpha/beta hydrolase fold domain-containing protein [Pseudonocardiaceae bacterium]|nr:alpha/beta hydrolase fold domain-containing protein [Pseudonocardiaceae bacterium]
MANPIDRIPVSAQAAAARFLFALPRPLRRALVGAPVRIDGLTLSSDAQLLLWLQRMSGMRLVEGDPVAARAALDASRPVVSGPPVEPVAARELEIPTSEGSIGARLYVPDGLAEGSALLVYYHGGGWVIGNLDSHDNTCRFLAKQAGVRVLSVDYRLAPEHPFPAAVDDAAAAFRYAAKNAAELGVNPKAIAVGGDSAGGNLAAVTAHAFGRSTNPPRPVFQLLIYPGVEGVNRYPSRDLFGDGFFLTDKEMDWFCDHYVPDVEQRSDPRFSVLAAEDLSGMPPTYLATAGFDPLRDEGEAFAERLREAGVAVTLSRQPDLIHGYASFLGLGTRFREAMCEAAGALRTGLALGPSISRPRARKPRRTASA